MSYPECEHAISLRIWSRESVIEELSQSIPLPVRTRGTVRKTDHNISFEYSEKSFGNLEYSIKRHLNVVQRALHSIGVEERIDVWFVVEMYEWALTNISSELLGELAKLDASISFENFN